jgi:hypothetical protein
MRRPKKKPVDWRGQVGMDIGEQRQRSELESSVQDRVRTALEAVGVRVERNNVGAIRKGQRFIRYGVLGKGAPDLFCFLAGGTVFFVETKRAKGGVITDEQRECIDELRAMGFVAGFARSPEDALVLWNEARTTRRAA